MTHPGTEQRDVRAEVERALDVYDAACREKSAELGEGEELHRYAVGRLLDALRSQSAGRVACPDEDVSDAEARVTEGLEREKQLRGFLARALALLGTIPAGATELDGIAPEEIASALGDYEAAAARADADSCSFCGHAAEKHITDWPTGCTEKGCGCKVAMGAVVASERQCMAPRSHGRCLAMALTYYTHPNVVCSSGEGG